MKKSEIEFAIKSYPEVLKLMKKPHSKLSGEELVVLAYIEYETVQGAANHLHSKKIRLSNGNLAQQADISKIINSAPEGVDKMVIDVAKHISKQNKRPYTAYRGR